MKGWKEYKLGDLSEVKGGKRLPLGSNLIETATSHPYIRTRDINNNKIAINELLFVPDEVFPAIKRYTVDKGDVIVSIVGTIGLCSIIPPKLHLASLTENCAKIVNIDEKILDKKYLFYYLISSDGQDEILSRNVGSTQPKLPLYNIKDIPILLPPLPEQKAIAAVLSSLDDKIDLLHRQNKTLEAMAETLFRQWFVEEADEGWEEKSLSGLIKISSGKGIKREQFTEDGLYPVLGANGIIGRTDIFLFDDKLIYTGRVGTLGNIFIVNKEKVWLSDNTLIIKPLDYFYTIFFCLKIAKLEEYNVGSTQPLLRQSDLNNLTVLLPSTDRINDFEVKAESCFNRIEFNNNQIRTLEKIRDTLLPKLMSGEVRVKV